MTFMLKTIQTRKLDAPVTLIACHLLPSTAHKAIWQLEMEKFPQIRFLFDQLGRIQADFYERVNFFRHRLPSFKARRLGVVGI